MKCNKFKPRICSLVFWWCLIINVCTNLQADYSAMGNTFITPQNKEKDKLWLPHISSWLMEVREPEQYAGMDRTNQKGHTHLRKGNSAWKKTCSMKERRDRKMPLLRPNNKSPLQTDGPGATGIQLHTHAPATFLQQQWTSDLSFHLPKKTAWPQECFVYFEFRGRKKKAMHHRKMSLVCKSSESTSSQGQENQTELLWRKLKLRRLSWEKQEEMCV